MIDAIAPAPVCHPVWDPNYWIPFALTHIGIGICYFPFFGIAFKRFLRVKGMLPQASDRLLILFVESCGIGHWIMALNLWTNFWYFEVFWHGLTVLTSAAFVVWVRFYLEKREMVSHG